MLHNCCRDAVDTTITDVVYMNVGVCPDGVRADRTLGDKVICSSTQPLGRIVIGMPVISKDCCLGDQAMGYGMRLAEAVHASAGLYGRLLPQTVSNFLMLAKGGAYSGTTFSKVSSSSLLLLPSFVFLHSLHPSHFLCTCCIIEHLNVKAKWLMQVVPGGYVQAGRQGSPRMGLVQPPTDLPANKELLASRSFRQGITLRVQF